MSVGDTTGAGDTDTTFYIFDLKIVCLMLYLKKTKELILPMYFLLRFCQFQGHR